MFNNNFEDIAIVKPLHSNYVCVYDKTIKRAIKEKKMLRIKIPRGIGIHDPKEWVKTGKVMEKVFKRPEEPMKLVCNYVQYKPPKTEEEQIKELAKLGVF